MWEYVGVMTVTYGRTGPGTTICLSVRSEQQQARPHQNSCWPDTERDRGDLCVSSPWREVEPDRAYLTRSDSVVRCGIVWLGVVLPGTNPLLPLDLLD